MTKSEKYIGLIDMAYNRRLIDGITAKYLKTLKPQYEAIELLQDIICGCIDREQFENAAHKLS